TTFQRCYDNRETSDVVTTMEQANIAAGFRSTPTFLANGNKADLKDTAADAASLLATLTAAAQVTAAPAATTPTGGQAAVTTSPAAPLATKPTAPSIRANADDQLTPPDLTKDGTAIVSNAAQAKPDAITLDIHMDYQCPICKQYENFFGASLDQLIQSGDVLARYHIRSFLDINLNNTSSRLAGIAATCADTVGKFQAYHNTVFAHQPSEGTGFTDDQLRNAFAGQAGIAGAALTTFQRCYDTRATLNVVENMENLNYAAGITGTPTFLANGAKVDLTQTPADPASILATLKAAARTS
ncbi:MAG: DsbA family protein, partial [Actinomycetia bacterium]|nr:DsbA family protein [Actinomycetes bacterium]